MCLFFVTDVGFGGWENKWEIMYHSANVTKYVGLEPLRPSSIITEPTPPIAPTQKALISTEHKRLNASRSAENSLCLAEGLRYGSGHPCVACIIHYTELVCEKTPNMPLRDNLGTVTYDVKKHKAVHPASVPEERH